MRSLLPRNLVIPLALGALVAAYWLAALFVAFPVLNPKSDFSTYYTAAAALRAGASPYDPATQEAWRMRLFGTRPVDVASWYFYPPWFLLFILPFMLLPIGTAGFVWFLLQPCAVWPACIYLLRRQLPQAWPLVAVWGLAWVPVVIVIKFGQISLLLLLAFLTFAEVVRHPRWDWLGGLCLTVLSFKPLLLLGPVLILLSLHRWKMLLAGGTIIAALAALVVDVYGMHLVPDYLDGLRFATKLRVIDPTWQYTSSLAAFTRGLGRYEWPALFLLSCGAVGVWLGILRWRGLTDATYTAPVLGILVSPHALAYEPVLCLAVLPALVSRPVRIWMPLVAISFLLPSIVQRVASIDPVVVALWLAAILGTVAAVAAVEPATADRT